MKIFALSDLHLSFSADKPMDIFGPNWVDHAARIEQGWQQVVGPEDWVLVAGDLSWAMTLAAAEPDLEFLGKLPGKKILSKGNHCHWWSSRTKVEAILPSSIRLLQNDAIPLGDGVVVAGARGWTMPGSPYAQPGDEKILAREVLRLEMSLAAAAKLEPRLLVVMTHYPPVLNGGVVSPLAPLIEASGARICVYGHLHGKDHGLGFSGERSGVHYVLSAADALDFKPVQLILPEAGDSVEKTE